MAQTKQREWYEQWKLVEDNEMFLFLEWIYPNTLDDFRGKEVLECGCGGGQHTSFSAPHAKAITAVDLNTTEIAIGRNKNANNVKFIEGDIAEIDIGKQFDLVLCIGVIHHTDDPDRTVCNLKRHVKPGGKLVLWVYSEEGNFLVKYILEPFRKSCLRKICRKKLLTMSKLITAIMYLPVFSLYLMPLRSLPYYEYFENFRKLSFYRNSLNVFDKVNAPQVEFMSRERVERWLNDEEFDEVYISHYKGVSWRATGRKNVKNNSDKP